MNVNYSITIDLNHSQMSFDLRKNCTPNRNWACFVRYLTFMDTLLENNMIILKQFVCKKIALTF